MTTESDKIIWKLELLRASRENQLNHEAYQSYNYGYVAGEVSGIQKSLDLIQKDVKELALHAKGRPLMELVEDCLSFMETFEDEETVERRERIQAELDRWRKIYD